MQTAQDQNQIVEKEASDVLFKARNFVVKTADERFQIAEFVKSLKKRMVEIEEEFHFTGNKQLAYQTYEAALDTEKKVYTPFNEAIKICTASGRAYDTAETLRIQREQREAQERREQAEREEKARREAEANAAQEAEEKRQLEEFERLDRERKAKLELQKSATESGNAKVAGIAAKEVAKIDAETQRVADEGAQKIAEIQAKAEEPAPTMAKFTPPPQPVKKLVWKARVTNVTKLCQEIAAGTVPFNVVEIRQSALNDFAKDISSRMVMTNLVIPGITFYQEASGRL